MNAELFEDQALNNISPLPKHVFDVPKIETKPNFGPIFYYYRFGAFHCKRAEACSVYSVSLVSSG